MQPITPEQFNNPEQFNDDLLYKNAPDARRLKLLKYPEPSPQSNQPSQLQSPQHKSPLTEDQLTDSTINTVDDFSFLTKLSEGDI